MLCENCKKNIATVQYINNINGYKTAYMLCEDCYNEIIKKQFNYEEDFISSLFNNGYKEARVHSDKVCSKCGAKLSEFNKTGLVGCSNCYKEFKEELKIPIKKIQGKLIHVGKSPKGAGSNYELMEEHKRLVDEFEKARREKRYDDADKINREISEISKLLNNKEKKGDI